MLRGIIFGVLFTVALTSAMAVFILLLSGVTIDMFFIYVIFVCIIGMGYLGLTAKDDRKKIDDFYRE